MDAGSERHAGQGRVDTTRPDDADSLRRLAESLGTLTQDRGTQGGTAALQYLVETAARDLVGARWASVTVLSRGRFRTLVATDDVARSIDAVQYAHGSGPCVDAVLDDATFLSPDIAAEERWQPLGRQLRDEFGVGSMLAYRLRLLDENDALAALNLASDRADAFSAGDVDRGLVLASHCALVVTAHLAQAQAENLLKALESNREIGVAVGVLMARYSLTRTQAFDLLRVASQHSNRKLVDIARDVGDTGLAPADVPGHRAP